MESTGSVGSTAIVAFSASVIPATARAPTATAPALSWAWPAMSRA